MEIQRANGSRTISVSGATDPFVTRVKMPLKENEVALIHQLVFHIYSKELGADFFGFISMAYSARSDESEDDIDGLAAYLRKMASQDVVGQCTKQFVIDDGLAHHELGGFDSMVVPIPAGGFPVAGDGTLIGLVNATSGQSYTVGVDVYFSRKRVSSEEWLKVARRSKNAPRDLNPPNPF